MQRSQLWVNRAVLTVCRSLSVYPGKQIDSAAHALIALACRFFEPRSVYLDHAPLMRSDSTRHPELAHNMRHRRSSYAKQLRKRLLRQRQDVTINSIVDVGQTPG